MDASDQRYEDALRRWAAAKMKQLGCGDLEITDVTVVMDHSEGGMYSTYTYDPCTTELTVEIKYLDASKKKTLGINYDPDDIGQLIRELILA